MSPNITEAITLNSFDQVSNIAVQYDWSAHSTLPGSSAYGWDILYDQMRSPDGIEQVIATTAEHLAGMVGKGWVKAGTLKPGDQIGGTEGIENASTVIACRSERYPQGIDVYNFSVDQSHTYFVRAAGSTAEPIWVHNACDLPAKGTLDGDAARYDRYLGEGGDLEFDDWYSVSRGGRSGGPLHDGIQAALEEAGYDTEVQFGERFADAAGEGQIHQIGETNGRGDPIARERDAINDILSSPQYAGEDIYFWDLNNPSAPPIKNPQLAPNWGDRP